MPRKIIIQHTSVQHSTSITMQSVFQVYLFKGENYHQFSNYNISYLDARFQVQNPLANNHIIELEAIFSWWTRHLCWWHFMFHMKMQNVSVILLNIYFLCLSSSWLNCVMHEDCRAYEWMNHEKRFIISLRMKISPSKQSWNVEAHGNWWF